MGIHLSQLLLSPSRHNRAVQTPPGSDKDGLAEVRSKAFTGGESVCSLRHYLYSAK